VPQISLSAKSSRQRPDGLGNIKGAFGALPQCLQVDLIGFLNERQPIRINIEDT
jgi:hypothetical protein